MSQLGSREMTIAEKVELARKEQIQMQEHLVRIDATLGEVDCRLRTLEMQLGLCPPPPTTLDEVVNPSNSPGTPPPAW